MNKKDVMYYLDLAVNKWFDKVSEALGKRDMKVVEEVAFKMAFNEHVELLRNNMPGALYGEQVKSIYELEREFMRGLNLLHAIALTEIFETIKEGEEHYFLNLKIMKRDGEICIEDVGWSMSKGTGCDGGDKKS